MRMPRGPMRSALAGPEEIRQTDVDTHRWVCLAWGDTSGPPNETGARMGFGHAPTGRPEPPRRRWSGAILPAF